MGVCSFPIVHFKQFWAAFPKSTVSQLCSQVLLTIVYFEKCITAQLHDCENGDTVYNYLCHFVIYPEQIKESIYTPVCLVPFNQTQVCFPFGADHSGRSEYSNHILVHTTKMDQDPAEEVVSRVPTLSQMPNTMIFTD